MRHYLLSISLLLTACGGGGGSNGNDTPTPVPPPAPPPTTNNDLQNNLSFVVPENIQQNQAIGIMAQLSGGHQVGSVSWKQLSGPNVFIAAPNSQLISFDATQSGNYSFELSLVTTANQATTKIVDFAVQASDLPQAVVRLDHVVTEGGKVSLRAEMSQNSNQSGTVSWTQTAGPQVTMDQRQAPFLFFTAPRVQQDTVLEFQASIATATGQTYQDKAYVLVKNANIDEQDGFFPKFAEQIVSEEMQPYVADSPYANVLAACVYSNTVSQSCDFNRLPLLGMQTQAPTSTLR